MPESKIEVSYSLKNGKLIVSGFIWTNSPPISAEFQVYFIYFTFV